MLHKTLFIGLLVLLASLVTSSKAQAWGAAHVGYTHVGPGGVYHAGRTAYGGYGGYGGYRYGSWYGYGGAYHYGAVGGYGGYRGYYGGYPYGGYGRVRAGYVRSW
jgi:hypothetical protein